MGTQSGSYRRLIHTWGTELRYGVLICGMGYQTWCGTPERTISTLERALAQPRTVQLAQWRALHSMNPRLRATSA
eukprot:2262528-Rhodomonas_salina.1